MLASLMMFAVGAAAGFAGARRLMASEALPAALPDEARSAALAARRRLLETRSSLAHLLADIETERVAAESELTEEYLQRTGRTPPTPASTVPQPPVEGTPEA